MHCRFVLSKNEVLKKYDKKLSWRAKQAIAMMNEESWYGEGDVGRLMQIQQFKGGNGFGEGTSADYKRFNTWRQHYIETKAPFLVVHVVGKRGPAVIIYKRREAIEDLVKKKYYQTHPEVKEKQKVRNRRTRELQQIRDKRGKLIAKISN